MSASSTICSSVGSSRRQGSGIGRRFGARTRRSPAMAGSPVRQAPNDDRLQHPVGGDRRGEIGQFVLEPCLAGAGWPRSGRGIHRPSSAPAGGRMSASSPRPTELAWPRIRHGPPPPRPGPRRRGLPATPGRTGRSEPWLGACSATLRVRRCRHGPVQIAPHLVGDLERQPGSTVEHRDHHSLDLETRVRRSPDRSDGIHRFQRPSRRTRLDRDEDPISRGERVDRQQAERRRAVDQLGHVVRPPRPGWPRGVAREPGCRPARLRRLQAWRG